MSKGKKCQGVVIPMVTPFTERGDIDHAAAERITDFFIEAGVQPFVLGTTGESASVPDAARAGYVETVVEHAAGKTMVYAGISSNCLKSSVEAAKKYFDLGADVVVAHLPSYYALVPDSMLRYFETLADSIPGPLTVYNIKATTHMSIPLELVDKLSRHPNIVGLKDSERGIERMEESVRLWRDRPDFSHLCGWAAVSAKVLLEGSDGIVPSTGNFVPKMFKDLYDAAVQGDAETAHRLQKETDEIAKVYQTDRILSQSLSALKFIMSELDLCGEAVLPPLYKVSAEEKAKIEDQLGQLGLAKYSR